MKTLSAALTATMMLCSSVAAGMKAEKLIAFEFFLEGIADVEQQEGRVFSVHGITQRFSMSNSRASKYVDFLLGAYDEIQRESKGVAARMLCRNGEPKYSLGESYAVLEVVEDIKLSALRRQFGLVRVYFGNDTINELSAWLDGVVAGREHPLAGHLKKRARSVEDTVLATCGMGWQARFAGN